MAHIEKETYDFLKNIVLSGTNLIVAGPYKEQNKEIIHVLTKICEEEMNRFFLVAANDVSKADITFMLARNPDLIILQDPKREVTWMMNNVWSIGYFGSMANICAVSIEDVINSFLTSFYEIYNTIHTLDFRKQCRVMYENLECIVMCNEREGKVVITNIFSLEHREVEGVLSFLPLINEKNAIQNIDKLKKSLLDKWKKGGYMDEYLE